MIHEDGSNVESIVKVINEPWVLLQKVEILCPSIEIIKLIFALKLKKKTEKALETGRRFEIEKVKEEICGGK